MAERRVSVREARASFSEILGQVHYARETVVIERKGRPFAALINMEEYELLKLLRQRDWEAVDRVRERNADKSPEEARNDVTTELGAVRGKESEKKAS